jgi:DNA-directed RNA polymerase specialized sigma24 family protein
LQLALERLKAEHAHYFEAVDMAVTAGRSYRDIAALLGRSEDAVDNYIRQAKAKLAEYLRAEVARYSSSPEEYEGEQRHLFQYLTQAGA